MNASWGQAAGRSDLVRLVLHLIVEEALEGEGADALEREAMRGEGEKAGYRNGYRWASQRRRRGGGLCDTTGTRDRATNI